MDQVKEIIMRGKWSVANMFSYRKNALAANCASLLAAARSKSEIQQEASKHTRTHWKEKKTVKMFFSFAVSAAGKKIACDFFRD